MPVNTSLRVIFAGTPTFAAHHLQVLIDSPHQIVAVYTQPDRPAGRGKRLSPSPVKQLALDHHLSVLQPGSLKTLVAQEELRSLDADVLVVVAYGLILPQAVLDIPPLGCINVHGSLLPRWRGAAPVQRAVEAGDTTTGITIMQMDAGLDTGPMLLRRDCEITNQDNSATVFTKLERLGGPALLTVLAQASRGKLNPQAQDDALASYAHKIEKAEAKLDWQLPAAVLHRKVRAFNPFPVTYCELACPNQDGPDQNVPNQKRIKIYAAKTVDANGLSTPGTIINTEHGEITVACGDKALAITQLQLPGKKALPAAAVLRGHASLFAVGTRLH